MSSKLVSEPGSAKSLQFSIAWRFLRGRGNRLLDGTARAALIATSVGVTAMVIAMALMSGYREDLRQKLVRGNAAVIAYPILGSVLSLEESTRTALAALPGVTAVRSAVYGEGSLVSRSMSGGEEVTLRGVDSVQTLEGMGAVAWSHERQPGDRLRSDEALELVIGSELALRLQPDQGDSFQLMVLGLADGRPRFRYRRARIVGTFTTGFSEFDQSWVVTDRLELEEMLGAENVPGMVEIAIEDPEQAESIAEQARVVLGGAYLVTNWRDLNRQLFTALKVQQVALFFVLGLIVLVSTFNVASSLVVLVRERMRDLGVLAALGFAPSQLRNVFLLYGFGLGAVGCLGGVVLGSLSAWILTEFELIRFEPELAAIYFISAVSFRIEPLDLLAVVGFTLLVTLVACWVPAHRAAWVKPARALRYQ